MVASDSFSRRARAPQVGRDNGIQMGTYQVSAHPLRLQHAVRAERRITLPGIASFYVVLGRTVSNQQQFHRNPELLARIEVSWLASRAAGGADDSTASSTSSHSAP